MWHNGWFYVGLDDYLDNQGLTSWSVERQVYSHSKIRECIDDDKPVIVQCFDIPTQTWDAHSVVAHGYYTDVYGNNYNIVNDTFGNNDVYISAISSYYYSDDDNAWGELLWVEQKKG